MTNDDLNRAATMRERSGNCEGPPLPDGRGSDRDRVLEEARQEYHRRDERKKQFSSVRRASDQIIYSRTMRDYERMLARHALMPLGNRTVLDVGCGRADFLMRCRNLWGQTGPGLAGIDLMADRIEEMKQTAPYLDVRCGGADSLEWPDDHFDLIHQSMLFTSVLDETLRQSIAAEMRRVTKPGGHLLWYDFICNPTNRATVGMPLAKVRSYFPDWTLADRRRITLAPPLSRRLDRISRHLVTALEACRLLNLFELVLLRKP